jgi:hypothetical protein
VTLLVDPALLTSAGFLIGRRAHSQRGAQLAGVALSAVVLGSSAATYREVPPMHNVGTRLGGRTGRDLILNSWVLRFDAQKRSPARAIVVTAMFAAYPVWTAIGVRRGWSSRR